MINTDLQRTLIRKLTTLKINILTKFSQNASKFRKDDEPKDDEMIIPTWLFDEHSTVQLYLPYSCENEEYTSHKILVLLHIQQI